MKWDLHVLGDKCLRRDPIDEGAVQALTDDIMRMELQRAQFEVQLYGDAIEQSLRV